MQIVLKPILAQGLVNMMVFDRSKFLQTTITASAKDTKGS
jgi:hypothetical protein